MKDWYELVQELDTTVSPLDEVTEARILSRVKRGLSPRRRRVSLAAVIAAVLLLTACGVAVASGEFSKWFWNISGDVRAPETSQALFEELGTVIGQSRTAGEITMTLDGALWDGEYLFLSLAVEGLEGDTLFMDKLTSLDSWLSGSEEFMHRQVREAYPNMTEEMVEEYWEKLAPFQRPEITFLADRKNGEHRLLVQRELSGQEETELTLHLENVELGKKTIEGPFEFTFTAVPKSITRVYTGDVVFEQEGMPSICISQVRISPFEVEMDFTALEEGTQISLEQLEIGSLMTGEKEITWADRSGLRTVTDEAGHTGYTLREGPFRQIVDPRAITAIGINGGWLELSRFTLQE